jgi:probable HAF family extracellular repeat protein
MKRVAFASAFSLAAAVSSAQPPTYTVREIPSPTPYGLRAKALNDNGQVVGYFGVGPFIEGARTPAHAFLYSGGVVQDLFPNDSSTTFSEANAVNAQGQVVGDHRASPGGYAQAFLRENGQTKLLSPLEFTPPEAAAAAAFGINDSGQIVGAAMTPDFQVHAFLLTPPIAFATDLNPDRTLPYFWSQALALNAAGQIVGTFTKPGISGDGFDTQESFFWDGQGFRYPEDLPGGRGFTPAAINASGQVAGFTTSDGQLPRAVVYDGVGLTELANPGDATATRAFGINAAGVVVGSATLADGTSRAVVWHDGAAYDLNSLLASQPGLPLREASAVSDAGQIVAWGGGYGSPIRSFLLTPAVPSTPATSIEGLIEQVRGLLRTGELRRRQAYSLIRELQAALWFLQFANGERMAAVMLDLFVREVGLLVRRGVLSPAEGNPLLDTARGVIAQLRAP